MLDSVQEKIREMHGLHGVAPGGTGWHPAEDAFVFDERPALPPKAVARGDAEIAEMAQKFEEILAELETERDERLRASPSDEEFRLDLGDGEVEAAWLARYAQPLVARSDERVGAQRAPLRELHASSASHAPSVSAALRPAHIPSKRAATILGFVVAVLAVSAGAVVYATRVMEPSDPSVRIAAPSRSGAGLRLDYELKPPSARVAGRKP